MKRIEAGENSFGVSGIHVVGESLHCVRFVFPLDNAETGYKDTCDKAIELLGKLAIKGLCCTFVDEGFSSSDSKGQHPLRVGRIYVSVSPNNMDKNVDETKTILNEFIKEHSPNINQVKLPDMLSELYKSNEKFPQNYLRFAR